MGKPGGFLFIIDPVVLNASTYQNVEDRFWNKPRQPTLKFRPKKDWTLLKNLQTKKMLDDKRTMHYALKHCGY